MPQMALSQIKTLKRPWSALLVSGMITTALSSLLQLKNIQV